MNIVAKALKSYAEQLWQQHKEMLPLQPESAMELKRMAFESARQAEQICNQGWMPPNPPKPFVSDLQSKIEKIAKKNVLQKQ